MVILTELEIVDIIEHFGHNRSFWTELDIFLHKYCRFRILELPDYDCMLVLNAEYPSEQEAVEKKNKKKIFGG